MADAKVIVREMRDCVASELECTEAHSGPYLSTMFRFLSRKGNSIIMLCLLCAPMYKDVSAYVLLPSNL